MIYQINYPKSMSKLSSLFVLYDTRYGQHNYFWRGESEKGLGVYK